MRELAPTPGTLPLCPAEGAGIQSLPLSRLLPPFLSPTPHPAILPLWAGLAEGPGGWGWGRVSPCEAHVERRAGEAAVAALSLFLAHWLLLGTDPGSPVSWAGRASRPVWGAPCWMDRWEGGLPSRPLHWHLWDQGAIFYQAPACHRTVPAVSS